MVGCSYLSCALLGLHLLCKHAYGLMAKTQDHVQTSRAVAPVALNSSIERRSGTSVSLENGKDETDFPWPLMYLHFPKCGAGFANTLVHAACPCAPKDEAIPGIEVAPGTLYGDADAWKCCDRDRIFRDRAEFADYWGHPPLDAVVKSKLPSPAYEHVVTMVRNPNERLLSGYMHGRHYCDDLREWEAPGCNQTMGAAMTDGGYVNPACAPLLKVTPDSVRKYAECTGRCMTNMLLGERCNGQISKEVLPVASAIDTLQQLAFVGLTDEFPLSICLWHVRFGGECLGSEFKNLHPGLAHFQDDDPYFTNETLALLQDDWRVYEKASEIFWNDIAAHEVTSSRCAALCPDAAELFLQNDSSTSVAPPTV
mmetsp:Transcript_65093/g.121298  ORF Transcript_65093/g.121298 Transcript_65093/m.121298 type:complete len:368 (+) Transcript_65093:94-1197(+)